MLYTVCKNFNNLHGYHIRLHRTLYTAVQFLFSIVNFVEKGWCHRLNTTHFKQPLKALYHTPCRGSLFSDLRCMNLKELLYEVHNTFECRLSIPAKTFCFDCVSGTKRPESAAKPTQLSKPDTLPVLLTSAC